MVRGDEAPGADLAIDEAEDAFLALELGDIPDDLDQREAVLADRLAHDLTIHQELDGGLAGVITTAHQETEESMGQDDIRRG